MVQHAASLLQHAVDTVKQYDEIYRRTGAKYNIFEIARIGEKEVIMCRVIADLLNPMGLHYKGSPYLKLFGDTVLSKIENLPKLDVAKTKVLTEYRIDE
jgi:hypothetical protein